MCDVRKMIPTNDEDVVFGRCLAWFEMYAESYEEGSKQYREHLLNLCEYFRRENNKFVRQSNGILWVEIDVMISEVIVAIDGDYEEEFARYWRILKELVDKSEIHRL